MVVYKPIPSCPGYQAGDDGSIIGRSGQRLRTWINEHGYARFAVYAGSRSTRRNESVHVAVCEAFHGARPGGMETAHRNGVRNDNRPQNLSWKTPVGNAEDRDRHGTTARGERVNLAKLTDDAVRQIHAEPHVPGTVLAARYGVTKSAISRVRLGRTWRHVS